MAVTFTSIFCVSHTLTLLYIRFSRRNRKQLEEMPSTDRAALVELFRSTDGANWKMKSNWNTDAGLDTWAGVKLNHAGRVVELSLPDNNLNGIAVYSTM